MKKFRLLMLGGALLALIAQSHAHPAITEVMANEVGSPGYSPLAPVVTPKPSTWALMIGAA